MARGALRELRLVLALPPARRQIGDRELVQEQLGRSVLRLQTIETLAHPLYARIDVAALGEAQSWGTGERYLPHVPAAQANELALECVQFAFRRSGTAALHKPNIRQKLLRDMSVATAHAIIDDSVFASCARHPAEPGQAFELRGAPPPPAPKG